MFDLFEHTLDFGNNILGRQPKTLCSYNYNPMNFLIKKEKRTVTFFIEEKRRISWTSFVCTKKKNESGTLDNKSPWFFCQYRWNNSCEVLFNQLVFLCKLRVTCEWMSRPPEECSFEEFFHALRKCEAEMQTVKFFGDYLLVSNKWSWMIFLREKEIKYDLKNPEQASSNAEVLFLRKKTINNISSMNY